MKPFPQAKPQSRSFPSALRGITIFLTAALATSWSSALAAQGYPAKPIRIIANTAPGSGHDGAARLVAHGLSARVGQPVLVENRPGGSNIIAAELVAKSPPDGHTLYMPGLSLVTVPLLHEKVPYDPVRDFTPVTLVVTLPSVLVVHPSLPARSVKELVALAKQRPGELTYASAGMGSANHLTMEVFLMMTGTRMLHVPYKAATPGILDLLGGRVSAMTPGILGGAPLARSGKLRALGVTGSKRVAALPDVPTIAEAGVPGYDVVQWWGMVAPAGTPREIISRLNRDIVAVLAVQENKDRLAREGAEVVADTPEEFGAFLRAETQKWAKVIRTAGIKVEQ